jgi:molybdenum cofactor biosynthesis enzyme MoaA
MHHTSDNRFEVYMFEPTNRCNLDCALCPTGNGLSLRTKGYMDLDLFERALERERIENHKIWLWGWGEPLLHPHLSMLVAASKRRNNSVEVQSNGTAPYESYRLLVEEGVDVLTVALDGMSDESLHSLRGIGASSTVVRERILELTSLCRSTGLRTKIHVQCIATRFNEQEIERIRDWSLRVAGADAFLLKTLCIGELTQEKAKYYLPKAPGLMRYAVDSRGIVSMPPRLRGDCHFFRNIRVVLWDFTVVPCCYDYGGEYRLGNLLSGCREEEFSARLATKEVPMCEICPELRGNDTFVREGDPFVSKNDTLLRVGRHQAV